MPRPVAHEADAVRVRPTCTWLEFIEQATDGLHDIDVPDAVAPADVVHMPDLPSLERELAGVRRNEIARDDEDLELGVRCMAAGIYDDQGKLVAGLSISAPADLL